MNGQRFIELRALALLVAAASVGCSSTGVGNPFVEQGQLELAVVAGQPSTSEDDGDALPGSALEHAVLVLANIQWLPCDEDLAPVVEPGPFVIDLVSGETRPAIPVFDAPDGGVCGFDAPLGPARDVAELAGRSLFFSGVRDDGVRFLLFADMRATLSVRSRDGESWAMRGLERPLVWEMQPRRWARRADLSAAEPSAWAGDRRIIRIDANRHPLLYALIRARLGSESRLLDRRSGADLGTVTSNED
jgi:hypothetical protein